MIKSTVTRKNKNNITGFLFVDVNCEKSLTNFLDYPICFIFKNKESYSCLNDNIKSKISRFVILEKAISFDEFRKIIKSNCSGEYFFIANIFDFLNEHYFKIINSVINKEYPTIIKCNFSKKNKIDCSTYSYKKTDVKNSDWILWGELKNSSIVFNKNVLEKINILDKHNNFDLIVFELFFKALSTYDVILIEKEIFNNFETEIRKNEFDNINVQDCLIVLSNCLKFILQNDNIYGNNNAILNSIYSRIIKYVRYLIDYCPKTFSKFYNDIKSTLLLIDSNHLIESFKVDETLFYFDVILGKYTFKFESKKILIYNWLPYNNPWNWGGGVNLYCKNIVNFISKWYPDITIYFISSGFAYTASTNECFFRKIDSGKGIKVFQYEIVNSPVPSDQRNLYRNPNIYIKSPLLKKVFDDFIQTFGPFDAIHFNNVEGLSSDCFELKEKYYNTRFIYSIHNYNVSCLVGTYFNRNKHRVCSKTNKTCWDCYECSRVDIKNGIALETYYRGLYGVGDQQAVEKYRWLQTLGLHHLDDEINASEINDYSKHFTLNINKYCDYILAVSKKTRDISINEGFSENKTIVDYIGTEVATKQIKKSAFAAKSGPLKIVFLGSDYNFEEKGYKFLTNSLSKMELKYAKQIEIVLTVRNSNNDDEIKNKLKDFKSLKIIHGYSHNDFPNIFDGCNLSIIPVLWEDNLPQIAIESVAYGIPTLSADKGGASELCDYQLFKFKSGDAADFLKHLIYFVNNKHHINEFWKHHNGLTTMDEHVDNLLNYYGIRAEKKRERDYFDISHYFAENNNVYNKDIAKYYQNKDIINYLKSQNIYLNSPALKIISIINKMFPLNSKRRAIIKKILRKK